MADPAHRRALGAAAHRAIQPMSIRHSFDHFWSVHEAAAGAAQPRGNVSPGPTPVAAPAAAASTA